MNLLAHKITEINAPDGTPHATRDHSETATERRLCIIVPIWLKRLGLSHRPYKNFSKIISPSHKIFTNPTHFCTVLVTLRANKNPYLDHLSNRCCNFPFRSTSASNRCIATPPAHLFPTLHISPPPPPSLYKTYHPSLKSHRSVQPSLHSSTSTRTPVHHITNPCFPASSSPSPSPASPQPTLSPPPPPLPLSNSSLTPNTTLPLTPNASPVPSTLVTTSMNYSTSNVTNALPSATPL